MSIYLPLSKFVDSNEAVVANGAVVQAEGMALVRNKNNQAAGVMPSTGTADDIFVGFSIAGTSAAPFPEGYFNKVETFIVPATGAVTLSRTPVTGQVGVYDITDSAAVSPVTVAGNQITGLDAGNEVRVTYKFALTVVEARALFGDVQPGGFAGAYVGQIGQAKRGVIYVSEFDASKNWAAATAVKLGANGQLTDQSGSGQAIRAVIISVPGVETPYLGLEFDSLA